MAKKDPLEQKGVIGIDTATFDSIVKALATIDERSIKVGLLESKGGANFAPGTAMTIAAIGAVHEFGSLYAKNEEGEQRTPERRWIRGTFEHFKGELVTMQAKIAKGLLANKVKPDQALKILGVWAVNKVKFYVKGTDEIRPELAASTIAQRKLGKDGNPSERPLVDTGLMVNSVNYVIDNLPASTKDGVNK